MSQRQKNDKPLPIDSTTGFENLTDLRRELEAKIKVVDDDVREKISKSTAKWAIAIVVVIVAGAFGSAISFALHLQSEIATIQTILKILH